jgi:hypothetical protein
MFHTRAYTSWYMKTKIHILSTTSFFARNNFQSPRTSDIPPARAALETNSVKRVAGIGLVPSGSSVSGPTKNLTASVVLLGRNSEGLAGDGWDFGECVVIRE